MTAGPRLPPAYYASVAVRGPWWTDYEPSLRVPGLSGGSPAAIWTAGEGPDVLLVAPGTGTHDLWSPLSPLLREHCTIHAMDRAGGSLDDDVDQVVTAATAVGARYMVGFADDTAVLRAAALRCPQIRRVLVLTPPGEVSIDEHLEPGLMRQVTVSSRDAGALTDADAWRLIDNVGGGDE